MMYWEKKNEFFHRMLNERFADVYELVGVRTEE
jgi:hypothetical protein